MDTYRTLASSGEAQFTEKRSRFLAFACYVADEAEARGRVAELRKRYYDARHICWAYAIGFNGESTRANDDGEPSGSAGKPILGRIVSAGLTFTLVCVVRYFGGVKLGTGGLAVAYKTAAALALEAATAEERIQTQRLQADCPYADVDQAMRKVRDCGADIVAREYTAVSTVLTIEVRLDEAARLRASLGTMLGVQLLS